MTPRVSTAKTAKAAVTVGAASTLVCAASRDRQTIVVGNDHATNTIYIALGAAAVANQGIRLNPAGGTIILDNWAGDVYAIATGASTNVIYSEY